MVDDSEEVLWAFDPDRDRWAAHGFETWAEAGPWAKAGVSPSEAAARRPKADLWRSWGFTVQDMLDWQQVEDRTRRAVGVALTPDVAVAWQNAGFDPASAVAWIDGPTETDHWAFTVNQAAQFRDLGFVPSAARAVIEQYGWIDALQAAAVRDGTGRISKRSWLSRRLRRFMMKQTNYHNWCYDKNAA